MSKRLLMAAYHFPPLAGSSGIQRTLRLVQHLPAYGWEPLVLSIDAQAYERTSGDLGQDVPASVPVRRAFGLDTARHLAFRGRYAAWMARPDRWISWRFDGVRQGLRMIREFDPQAIWTTYPIATAHVIGAELQRRSGLPWVADFRDPMAQDGYPDDSATWRRFEQIEQDVFRQASLNIFTTPSALKLYQARYPAAAARMALLENGYDEESFVHAPVHHEPLCPGQLTILHSGIVYGSERDPTQLFVALGRLSREAPHVAERIRVRFRAPVHDDLLHGLAERHGVRKLVEVCPPLPYREALGEMMRADALMVLQAENCNTQIPAKIYEYLRAGRPVFCLSHPDGDTEAALRRAGVQAHARLDEPGSIMALLRRLLDDLDSGELRGYLPELDAIHAASRAGRAKTLAGWLDKIVEGA